MKFAGYGDTYVGERPSQRRGGLIDTYVYATKPSGLQTDLQNIRDIDVRLR